VKKGLERQTAGLERGEALQRYSKTRLRMSVKNALDAMEIKDKAKRRNIHTIMQRMGGRTEIAVRWGKVQSRSDALGFGATDSFIDACWRGVAEEVGDRKLTKKFFRKFLRSYIPLIFRLKLKKKK